MAKQPTKSADISVMEVETGELTFNILGRTPLVLNRMANKAVHQLLLPKPRKTAADKAANLKHNPLEEYRDSVYRNPDDAAPTRLVFPAAGFKRSIANAALDLPGLKKAQIGRLTWVEGENVNIFGVPQLYMAVVRSADINRTPDIRTRAIVPYWGCQITVRFVRPLTKAVQVANLLAAAGVFIGIGDGRQEKGALSFGQFELVDDDNADFRHLIEHAGREAQDRALDDPAMYDIETADMFEWFSAEVIKLHDQPKKGKAA